MPGAVVLLSGGLDSATTLAVARSQGFDVYALSVDYGQRHRFELEASRKVAKALGARDHIQVDVDLSRTVGWFTSIYPVRLDPSRFDIDLTLAGGPELGRALKALKEQLRAVPNNGIGFGLLRYLNTETAQELAGLPADSSVLAHTLKGSARAAGTAGRRTSPAIAGGRRRGWP